MLNRPDLFKNISCFTKITDIFFYHFSSLVKRHHIHDYLFAGIVTGSYLPIDTPCKKQIDKALNLGMGLSHRQKSPITELIACLLQTLSSAAATIILILLSTLPRESST
jgi:hypothetical protein